MVCHFGERLLLLANVPKKLAPAIASNVYGSSPASRQIPLPVPTQPPPLQRTGTWEIKTAHGKSWESNTPTRLFSFYLVPPSQRANTKCSNNFWLLCSECLFNMLSARLYIPSELVFKFPCIFSSRTLFTLSWLFPSVRILATQWSTHAVCAHPSLVHAHGQLWDAKQRWRSDTGKKSPSNSNFRANTRYHLFSYHPNLTQHINYLFCGPSNPCILAAFFFRTAVVARYDRTPWKCLENLREIKYYYYRRILQIYLRFGCRWPLP